jgi:protein-tyrosine phosphatase
MLRWVIDKQLARGRRPGYTGEQGLQVSRTDVDAWVEEVRSFGVKSIICLLADDQLVLYSKLSSDLVGYYRQAGFSVAHVPAEDHQRPPLTESHLERIWEAYQSLPKPVLVHCSAGIDRTGRAVEYITKLVGHVA